MGGKRLFDGDLQVVDNVSHEKLVSQIAKEKEQCDAFFMFNVGELVEQVRNWKLKLPRVKVFYAVKANDSQHVLDILEALGTGFDCASQSEIERVKAIGVDNSRIIYAQPCKQISHLKAARTFGVDMMTFDNEAELHKINDIFPNAKLVLRIRSDALKSVVNLGSKFGVLPSEAEPLLQLAFSLGLNVIGLSFHVGFGCLESSVFTRAIQSCRTVFEQATVIGFTPYLLDIGGGFPGDDPEMFNECADHINEALAKFFPEELGVQVIAEPGAYIVTTAFTNAAQITSKREKLKDNGDILQTMYYINDGIYGSFQDKIRYNLDLIPRLASHQSGPKSSSCIWGPTCDGRDLLIDELELPILNIGEWLMWDNMGAYTLSMGSNFNGFPSLKVYSVISRSEWIKLQEIMSGSDFNLDWSSVVSPNDQ